MALYRLYSDNSLSMLSSVEAGLLKSIDMRPCHIPTCSSALLRGADALEAEEGATP